MIFFVTLVWSPHTPKKYHLLWQGKFRSSRQLSSRITSHHRGAFKSIFFYLHRDILRDKTCAVLGRIAG